MTSIKEAGQPSKRVSASHDSKLSPIKKLKEAGSFIQQQYRQANPSQHNAKRIQSEFLKMAMQTSQFDINDDAYLNLLNPFLTNNNKQERFRSRVRNEVEAGLLVEDKKWKKSQPFLQQSFVSQMFLTNDENLGLRTLQGLETIRETKIEKGEKLE